MPSSRLAAPALFLLAAAAAAGAQGLQFTDVAAAVGLGWSPNDPGYLIGAGGAFLDYDLDGDDDIYLAGGDTINALYRNDGNGGFTDVTIAAGVIGTAIINHWSMGVAVADYDNDGDPDIYLCVDGPNVLYRNNGNGTFTDVTVVAGAGDARWTCSAAWADYDRDGWLDLYIGNYIQTLSFPFHTPWPNRLLHNNGNGTFSDVTAVCGVGGFGTTLAVLWTDFDHDGDQDLMAGNDFGNTIEPNRLYRNDGPLPGPPGSWSFTEVGAALGASPQIYCMGIAPGDFDRDLDLDYYLTNIGAKVLLRNDGPLGFADVAGPTQTGMAFQSTSPLLHYVSWGCGFHDFDRDGWLDLYVTNGYIPAASFINNGPTQPNKLFRHDGPSLTFSDVTAAAGVGHTGIGRGSAFSDYDRDGDIDILQVNIQDPPNLFRNDTAPAGGFLRVRPVGRVSARDAHGTRVQADLPGGVSLIREVSRNYGFESSSEPVAHIGLGTATEIARIRLEWPSGVVQEVFHLPANVAGAALEPVLDVDPASTATSAVSEGGVFAMNLVIRNRRNAADTAHQIFEISAPGVSLVLPFPPAAVPALGTASVPLAFGIPAGFTGGTPIAFEILWTVYDAQGGFDQWRVPVLVSP